MSATKHSPPRNKHSNGNGHNDSSSLDITKEEFSRIKDALENKEFRDLFLEYVDEIQDPENRKRYEEEITQLEAERGVDIKFVNPQPGFVIKTSVDGEIKCFINIAQSSEVEKPKSNSNVNQQTGECGVSWAIPMAQTAPRDDLDANGKLCRVYDVIFHTEALALSERDRRFRKCLIDTALDAVEREYKVKLDRTNLKFPKMQFKGIARPSVIRKLAKDAPAETLEPHPLENIYPARPSAESATPKVIPMKTETVTKQEFTAPKYVIKYRHDVDLSEYTNELDAKLNVTVPRQLIVEIELPLLKTTAECQLDVTSKSVYLLSERAGAKYRLKLDLPYAVDDKEGTARFDTDMRRLSITLPVVQHNATEQRAMHDTLLHLNREDSGVESIDEVNSNRESPVEELSDTGDETATETKSDDNQADVSTTATFLKNDIEYQFPTKFDCNVLDNFMSLVLHVRNVQPESINLLQHSQYVHLQFSSIGSGYYPTHYAFYLQLPQDADLRIVTAEPEAWENNVVLTLNLSASSEHLENFLAGLDSDHLNEYAVQGQFQAGRNTRARNKLAATPAISLASSLDISVEHSECEKAMEIEIKACEQQSVCGASNTTEDDEIHCSDVHQTHKKLNKKQRKRIKKARSLSESACDDIKAYQEQQNDKVKQNLLSKQGKDAAIDDVVTKKPITVSRSVDVPATAVSAQQRKQRSYSECRDSVTSGSANGSLRSILKPFSRYSPRASISGSNSSFDDYYSRSMDAGVSSSLHYSQSFSDIPEENVTAGLSESCKKTVRFDEVIQKQVFRLDSSILGQRKKNQKRRDRKQRALQRRHSEGDSADYEDNKPETLQENVQYFKPKGKHNDNGDINDDAIKPTQHDSGLDLSTSVVGITSKSKKPRARLESESSSDVETSTSKNAMMFDIDI